LTPVNKARHLSLWILDIISLFVRHLTALFLL
jgi:hypothetical protein